MKGNLFHILVPFVLAAFAGAGLFWTSQNVQTLNDDLAKARIEIMSEQETIRVLRAEWDYLNNPERLEKVADDYFSGKGHEVGTADLVQDPEYLPEPFVPVVPKRKPVLSLFRAVVKSGASSSSSSAQSENKAAVDSSSAASSSLVVPMNASAGSTLSSSSSELSSHQFSSGRSALQHSPSQNPPSQNSPSLNTKSQNTYNETEQDFFGILDSLTGESEGN